MKNKNLVLTLGLMASLLTFNVWATTITVSTQNDVIANDGLCSLREAVIAANTNVASGSATGECPAGSSPSSDVINLSGGTYCLSLTRQNTSDTPQEADLDITESVIILGGSTPTTIDAGYGSSQCPTVLNDRVFEVRSSGIVNLRKLNITGGYIHYGSPAGQNIINGAGIASYNSPLSLDRVDVYGNSIQIDNTWDGGAIKGTGVYFYSSNNSSGNFSMSRSSVYNNHAIRNAGTSTWTTDSYGADGLGVFIDTYQAADLYNSTITNNTYTSDVPLTTSTNPDVFSPHGLYIKGGANSRSTATLSLSFMTIDGNTVPSSNSSQVYAAGSVPLEVKSSVIPDIECGRFSSVDSYGYNAFAPTALTCANYNEAANPGTDLLSTPLTGRFRTDSSSSGYLRFNSSAAIDASLDCTLVNGTTNGNDQLNRTRPRSSNCDIGAFEH